eukprot:SAG31_NODE_167_length_21485_cov_31.094922_13_plen_99_part_00
MTIFYNSGKKEGAPGGGLARSDHTSHGCMRRSTTTAMSIQWMRVLCRHRINKANTDLACSNYLRLIEHIPATWLQTPGDLAVQKFVLAVAVVPRLRQS